MATNDLSYKGLYAMHKYWGKKPFNEISKFINKYSKSGDTVLDCFCGSGITLIEALKLNRKAIGIDLNPLAIELSDVSTTPIDLKLINATFLSIKKSLKTTIDSLYECEYNGEKTSVTHIVWKDSKSIEVWYKKQGSSKKLVRDGIKEDLEMSINPSIKPKWTPKTKMFENARINVHKDQAVADLFTPRALTALSLLREEIKNIDDSDIRKFFEITFTGTLSQASNLVFVIRRRNNKTDESGKAEVGSWVIGYWVPDEHFEINAWNCFENRYKRMIKGVEEINSLFPDKAKTKRQLTLYNTSATDMPINDKMVDYVFIDPPHVNRILYMEQSLMWNAWLGLDENINWDKEIIVSEAKARRGKKNNKNYNELLHVSFAEIKRVLKNNKYLSLAFNCLDDDTWFNLLKSLSKLGFEIVDVIPLEYSATSVVQDNRKNALKTDLVLTFKNAQLDNIPNITFREDDDVLRAFISGYLKEHKNAEMYNVMNELFKFTIPNGYIYRVSKITKIYSTLVK